MNVTLVNMTDGSVQGHRTGCADLAKTYRTAEKLPFGELESKREAFLAYNGDFLDDGTPEDECYKIDWKPCAAELPELNEPEQPETPLARTYDIPELDYEMQDVSVLAELVQKGDHFGGWVAGVTRGTKWVTLTDEAGRKLAKLEKGEMVQVRRPFATEESKAAQQRAYQNQAMQIAVREADTHYQNALGEFTSGASQRGSVDSHRLDSLLEAGAAHELMVGFRRFAENEKFADMVEAREAMVEALRERYTASYRHRALSRSTSVTGNLLEDVEREKSFDFIEGKYWF